MKYVFLIGVLFISVTGFSQSNLNEIFAAGINDADYSLMANTLPSWSANIIP